MKTLIRALVIAVGLSGSAHAAALDLSTLNGGSNFASGTIFTDPAGLGWDLTVTSSGANTVTVNSSFGLGVAGGNTSAMDSGEFLVLDFDPLAALEGFRIRNGANESLIYVAVADLGPSDVGMVAIPNAGSGGGDWTVGVELNAESLIIMGMNAPSGFRVQELLFADEPLAVPEPSTYLAMGGLLMVCYLLRRGQLAHT